MEKVVEKQRLTVGLGLAGDWDSLGVLGLSSKLSSDRQTRYEIVLNQERQTRYIYSFLIFVFSL